MTDDYASRIYAEQQLRSQEASRQAFAAIDSMRAARDQQIYWQQFYRFFDQQRDQLLEQQRVANEALARSWKSEQGSAPAWSESAYADASAMTDEQKTEYSAAFHNRFSETTQLDAVWHAASEDASSWDEARSRFWSLVNAAESTDAQYVQELLVAAGYRIRDGDKAPVLEMPTYDAGVGDLGRRGADLILEIDHANPRVLPVGVAVEGRDRRLSLDEELNAENLRFMSGRDNRFRGNRYGENDEAFDADRKVRSGHREFVMRVAQEMLERAVDAKDQWLYWQQFYRFFDQQRDVLLDTEVREQSIVDARQSQEQRGPARSER